MTPAPERPVEHVRAIEEPQHGWPAHSEPLEGATDAEIATRREQSLLQRLNRSFGLPGALVHLCKVQVKLGVVPLQAQRVRAHLLCGAVLHLRVREQKSGVGEIVRIPGLDFERAVNMIQRPGVVASAQAGKPLFEFCEAF